MSFINPPSALPAHEPVMRAVRAELGKNGAEFHDHDDRSSLGVMRLDLSNGGGAGWICEWSHVSLQGRVFPTYAELREAYALVPAEQRHACANTCPHVVQVEGLATAEAQCVKSALSATHSLRIATCWRKDRDVLVSINLPYFRSAVVALEVSAFDGLSVLRVDLRGGANG